MLVWSRGLGMFRNLLTYLLTLTLTLTFTLTFTCTCTLTHPLPHPHPHSLSISVITQCQPHDTLLPRSCVRSPPWQSRVAVVTSQASS